LQGDQEPAPKDFGGIFSLVLKKVTLPVLLREKKVTGRQEAKKTQGCF
jgi:hypothetical protein